MSDRSAVRRLALGDFLSSTGSGIAAVALSFFVYQQTNSARSVCVPGPTDRLASRPVIATSDPSR